MAFGKKKSTKAVEAEEVKTEEVKEEPAVEEVAEDDFVEAVGDTPEVYEEVEEEVE